MMKFMYKSVCNHNSPKPNENFGAQIGFLSTNFMQLNSIDIFKFEKF